MHTIATCMYGVNLHLSVEVVFLAGECPREPHRDLRRPGTAAALESLIEAIDGPDKLRRWLVLPR